MGSGIKIIAACAVALVGTLLFLLQRHRDATIAWIGRFGVPLMMTISYVVLALTSDVDATGIAWLSLGLAFVMVVWFILRFLMTRAALTRALAVGDFERILDLADVQIRERRGRARIPFQIARVRAYDLHGDWANVLAELDALEAEHARVPLSRKLRWELAALRAGALVELAKPEAARAAVDAAPPAESPAPRGMDDARAWIDWHLANARILFAVRDAGARASLEKITHDIRATELQRAVAHHYLARLDPDDAAHAKQAARFAPPESWLAAR